MANEGMGDGRAIPSSLIGSLLTKDDLKIAFYQACRVDIADNNDKAMLLKRYFEGRKFREIGTGTNRWACIRNGFVFKFALDRRGLVDNLTEFRRSAELPSVLAKCYECTQCGSVAVFEYVTVMDKSEFADNEGVIRRILKDLSARYLFDDLWYTQKNYYNWGYRRTGDGEDNLVILDYGYMYPILNVAERERIFRCPRCQSRLEWNQNFEYLQCYNTKCRYTMSGSDLRTSTSGFGMEEIEQHLLEDAINAKLPDLDRIEEVVSL